MTVTGLSFARATDNARAATSASQIARTQSALALAQRQLSTGRRLDRPSDDAADAIVAQQIRKDIETRTAHGDALRHGQRLLGDVDEALAGATDLVREARTTALANLTQAVSRDEQRGAAVAIREIRSRLLEAANTSSGGIALFGGDRGGERPYVDGPGGAVLFRGSESALGNRLGEHKALGTILPVGGATFGGLSERVGGGADLAPRLSADTRLSDLAGSRGAGVSRGIVRLHVGTASAEVDLGDADTVGDVLDRLNASGLPVTASLSAAGEAITLTGTPSVRVSEAGGTTAADLGLIAPTPAATVDGGSLRPRITPFTPLADLAGGAGVDMAGGLTVTDAAGEHVVDLTGATTVGDLLDRLNSGPAAVRAEISGDGRSLLLRNPSQGTPLRVRENTGTTAADLGWLTFTAGDSLSQLNAGQGVRLDPAGPDLTIRDDVGLTFDVDLDGAATVSDAVDLINAAATNAGATTAASFDPAGPGLVLANVAGVSSTGESSAASDLGLDGEVSATGELRGRDVNPVVTRGVFGHLDALIAALDGGDLHAGEAAVAGLEADEERFVSQRGDAGARAADVEERLIRIDDRELADRESLSRLEDTDFAETISRYQSLQTSLQATLQTTGQGFGLTLFDFLR